MRGVFFTCIFISSLFFVGCNQSNENSTNVFKYNESNGISSLDPAYTRNLENMWAVNQLFDGLVELDENLNVVPLIAKSWDIQDSGKTYVFHLRSDVFFHESEVFPNKTRSLVAQDFFYSFNRILDPKVASPGKWIFQNIDVQNSGFEALDDSTFVIRLKKAFPPFLGLLATQYCNVLPKEAIDFYGEEFRSNPVGTGPFKFAFWMEDVALVYHKNERFWQTDANGNKLPYLDAIKIDFVRDMSAEYLGLLQGEYDFMSGIHIAYKDELLDPFGGLNESFKAKIKFQKTPFLKTDYIGILVDDSLDLSSSHPLQNRELRYALNISIDRASMTRYLRNNAVYPADHGFIPKGLPSFNENAEYGFNLDVQKAKEIVEHYKNTEGEIPPIVLGTTSDYVDLCQFLSHEWEKIGIKVNIDILPSSTHREKVSGSQLMMFRKSWLADYPDAENFLSLFYSPNFCPSGPNYAHFRSLEFDILYENAISEIDNAKRFELYTSMDSIVMHHSPVIPLFYDQVSHFVSNEVIDFETNGVNMLDLKETKKRSN